ncbi:DoxX family protein [Kocuria arenosa]|uniref:DoxX family protein n=1 Tax=Kocuria arenosa TaxID=3071446 RepID=UPI0034D6ADDA
MSTPRLPQHSSSTTLGWTLLRAVLGLTFALHGWQKFTESTIAGTQAGFAQMGIPMAGSVAPLTAAVELVGGILLSLGLGTRIVAALLGLVALGALVLVHLPNGFFAANGGIEFVLVLVLAAATVFFALAGPGPWSADRAISTKRTGDRALV